MTLTHNKGNDKVTLKFNVTNTVNPDETDQQMELSAGNQEQQSATELKSRPFIYC